MGQGIGVLGVLSPNYIEKGQGFMRNAIQAHSARSDKYKNVEPGKTAGGALMSAAGGAAAGTQVMPGWGTAIGGAVGLFGYALG